MSKRFTLFMIFGFAAVFIFGNVLFAADFVGATKCKMCHLKEFKSWEQTKMAKAFALLKPEEQKDEKCAPCHTTGWGKSATVLEGVQCEACHGAGSDYKAKEVMKDHEKAVAAGLLMADEKTCKTCHNEKSPTFKGFTYDKVKGIHEHIKK